MVQKWKPFENTAKKDHKQLKLLKYDNVVKTGQQLLFIYLLQHRFINKKKIQTWETLTGLDLDGQMWKPQAW